MFISVYRHSKAYKHTSVPQIKQQQTQTAVAAAEVGGDQNGVKRQVKVGETLVQMIGSVASTRLRYV